MSKNLIFLGAPGAGKGTQADLICSHYKIPHISTGDIIRQALKTGTELGKQAKGYIEKGLLVPDELVIDIIKERIIKEDCKDGFVLDGFPRTIAQAEALDNMGVKIDKVLNFHVEDSDIIKRMSGRRVCDKCGSTFHIEFNPSENGEMCDKCTGTLIQRKDDKPEIVKDRLDVYHKETEPLIDYYEKQNMLFTINGNADINEITKEAIAIIEA